VRIAGVWAATGSLVVPSDSHSATLLQSGEVLVAGGYASGAYVSRAEIFHPALRTWTLTNSLSVARGNHTGTLLVNGKVLVAGGQNQTGMLASAELYDPVVGAWAN